MSILNHTNFFCKTKARTNKISIYLKLVKQLISKLKRKKKQDPCFLRDLPSVSLILCFRRSTEVSPYLSYLLTIQ